MPGPKPLVSVVIPAYNPGSFLSESLRSVVSQDYQHWECLVVDDGSTEDLTWVEQIDPRIHLIRQHNSGVSAARNAGITASAGQYVAFLDADDLWLPTKLSQQVTCLEAIPSAVLSYTAASYIDGTGKIIGRYPYTRHLSGYRDLLQENCFGTGSVVARRVAIIRAGGFDVTLQTAEDYDLWLRMSMLGELVFIEDSLAQYRLHGNNASSNAVAMAQGVEKVLLRHQSLAHSRGEMSLERSIRRARRMARDGWGASAYDQARTSLAERKLARFGRRWIDALRLNPRYTLLATCKYLLGRAPPSIMKQPPGTSP